MKKPIASESWTDQRIETILGSLLRIGVMVSAAVVSVGAVIYLVRHGASEPDYHVFRGEPADLRSVAGILGNTFRARGRGFIQLGFLLLIAVPLMRVLFSFVAFARQGDRTYVVVTLIVLVALLYSLAGG